MAALEEQITMETVEDIEVPTSNEINAGSVKKSYCNHGSNLEKTIRKNIDSLERIKIGITDVKQKKAIDEIIQEFNDGERYIIFTDTCVDAQVNVLFSASLD